MLRLWVTGSARGTRAVVVVSTSHCRAVRFFRSQAPGPFSSSHLITAPTALTQTQRAFASTSHAREKSFRKARTVDHYRRLGVAYEATPAEIKAAYRMRALECHPDVVEPHLRGEAEVLFRGCSESFAVLYDATTRKAHDAEIGVEALRRQRQQARQRHSQHAAAAASSQTPPGKVGYRSSTFGSAYVRDAGDVETDEERAYYQSRPARPRSTRASSSTEETTASRPTRPASRRQPFVRGDADRVFREAFEGKSLDQILFEAQRRRRREAASTAAAQAVAATRDTTAATRDTTADAVSSSPQAAGREAVLRRVMENASQRYAEKIARQYGPGMLSHIQASRAPWDSTGVPATPPSTRMPYRPFTGTVVPDGVSAPAPPTLGPLGSATDGSVAPDDIELSAAHNKAAAAELEALAREWREATAQGHTLASTDLKKRLAARRRELGLLQYELADGSLLGPGDTLDRVSKRIDGASHNMGQLYSFHRPY